MASQPKTRQTLKAITQELPLEEMLARVAEGATQTQLAALVSERLGKPTSQYYISKWISSDPDRQEAWRKAKQLAADKYADQVAETIEAVKQGTMGANEAKTVMSGAQWLASRLSPAQWGDRLEVNQTTVDITALHIEAMRNQMRTVSQVDKESE